MKLLSIERSIAFVDVHTMKLVEKVILQITVDQLKKIVDPKNDDEDIYYDNYELNENQIYELNKFAEHKIIPDFNKYLYVLQCGGEYDWTK